MKSVDWVELAVQLPHSAKTCTTRTEVAESNSPYRQSMGGVSDLQ